MPVAYERFLAGQREFGDRVHAIAEHQWDAPTPDAGWTVADLVRHLIDEQRWAVPLVEGLDLASAGSAVPPAGTDLTVEWDDGARGSAAVFAGVGALDRNVDLERGRTTAGDYLAELTVDLVVHAWDLGRAIDYPDTLPDDLVSAVADDVDRAIDPYPTMFDPPVGVASDAAPLDRLIARTGRDPNWSAP